MPTSRNFDHAVVRTEPWFAVPVKLWPAVREAIPKPWPEQAAIIDLRWWQDQVHVERAKKMPGRRALTKIWGWSERRVRTLLEDRDRWLDPMKPAPAGGVPRKSQACPVGVPQGEQTSALDKASSRLKRPRSVPAGSRCRPRARQDTATQHTDTAGDPPRSPSRSAGVDEGLVERVTAILDGWEAEQGSQRGEKVVVLEPDGTAEPTCGSWGELLEALGGEFGEELIDVWFRGATCTDEGDIVGVVMPNAGAHFFVCDNYAWFLEEVTSRPIHLLVRGAEQESEDRPSVWELAAREDVELLRTLHQELRQVVFDPPRVRQVKLAVHQAVSVRASG